jgi:hypothetical protein
MVAAAARHLVRAIDWVPGNPAAFSADSFVHHCRSFAGSQRYEDAEVADMPNAPWYGNCWAHRRSIQNSCGRGGQPVMRLIAKMKATPERRRMLSATVAALCSALLAATAAAAPTIPLATAHALRVNADVERAKGSITLIPLDDSERALVAIAATFNVSKYCDATSVIVSARVNGVAIEPPFPAFIDRSADGCSATGVFRLDLDAAELIHPGAFLGQPLNVTLTYWG